MTEDQAPRQNRDGHPCPPLCTTDHDQELFPGHFIESHGADSEFIEVGGYDRVSARACQVPSRQPEVQVTLSGKCSVFAAPPRAEELASLIEALADATPDQHRELAAAIRQAAAQITEAEAGR
jgi:hypothetical protein